MAGTVDLTQFLAGYLAEVEELLASANSNVLALEGPLRRGETSPRAVRELFRAFHTIKGLSAMVGVEEVVAITHGLESLLRRIERAPVGLAPATLDVLVKGLQAVEHRVGELAAGKPVSAAPPDLLSALDALHVGGEPAARRGPELALDPTIAARLTGLEREELARGVAAGQRAVRIDFAPSPERAAEGITITTVREALGRVADVVKVVPVAAEASERAPSGLTFTLVVVTRVADAELAAAARVPVDAVAELATSSPAEPDGPLDDAGDPDAGPASELARRSAIVRVDVARLDEAMERLSALVVTRHRLERAVADLRASGVPARELAEIVTENSRQLRDLRAAIVRVRMVPVADLLERLPLLARGLRRATGKAVRVQVDAGHAELDKAVADRILPALVHLLRNAVDHGIEPPAERRRLGKPEEGLVAVACHERSNNQLELVVRDDGRGVDRDEVARRAGREPPRTDAGLLELLCTPGLSTKDHVTTTSGRGVGMDVVRRIVDQLGGELLLATTPGQGTAFTLRVPLTISIVEAFALEAAGQRYVVPIALVEEIVELDPTGLVEGPAPADRRRVGVFQRRGEAVPVVGLATAIAARGRDGRDGGQKALVVRRSGEPFAFTIDRMLGQQEVVIRPLEDPLVRRPGITGTTDLGDGRPTLVLDLVALSASITGAAIAREARP